MLTLPIPLPDACRNVAPAIAPPTVRQDCDQPQVNESRPPFRVKLRRTQREQMSSELPLKADIAQYSRHVSKMPLRTSPTSSIPLSTNRPVGQITTRRREHVPRVYRSQ